MRHLGPGLRSGPHNLLPLTFWLLSLGAGGGVGLGLAAARAESGGARPAVTPAAPAMTRAAFSALLMQLQRKSFGDEQLGLVRNTLQRGPRFTCEQAGQLVRATAAGTAPGQIAATLYPRVVDPENLDQLIVTLPLASDRQQLRSLIDREAHR